MIPRNFVWEWQKNMYWDFIIIDQMPYQLAYWAVFGEWEGPR